jgi:deoxyadenosine/deoxycytidine kinase
MFYFLKLRFRNFEKACKSNSIFLPTKLFLKFILEDFRIFCKVIFQSFKERPSKAGAKIQSFNSNKQTFFLFFF